MRQFKEFKSEQQYVTEVGPIAATLAGVAGLVGGAIAAKKLVGKFKSYKKSQAEKKENRKGITIKVKEFNKETGKIEDVPLDIDGDEANVDNEGIAKLEKKKNLEAKSKNNEDERKWKKARDAKGMNDKQYVDHLAKERRTQDRMDDGEEPNEKGFKYKYKEFDRASGELIDKEGVTKSPMFDDDIGDMVDKLNQKAKKQLAAYKKARGDEGDEDDTTSTPPEDQDGQDDEEEPKDKSGDDEEPEKEVDPEQELRSKGDAGEIDDDGEANAYYKLVGKAPTGWTSKKSKSGKSFELIKKSDMPKGAKDKGGFQKVGPNKMRKVYNSRVLKFGEFIKEDVMKDLKKISKSKKDMEIKLGDGAEIPIDPMTAEIFVKYIEGLKSSEQKKVINQIQRTERGFMKVLGKAHGE
jgi:hypothetical protein